MANISEIARLAGVSTATISRVINRHPYVSESTRKKVIEIMEQLDYVPNGNAISLKKGATCLIGIVAVAFNPLLIRFIQAFTQSAEKHGFNITLFITNGQVEKELVALEMLKRKQLDAIVCVLRSNEWKVIRSIPNMARSSHGSGLKTVISPLCLWINTKHMGLDSNTYTSKDTERSLVYIPYLTDLTQKSV